MSLIFVEGCGQPGVSPQKPEPTAQANTNVMQLAKESLDIGVVVSNIDASLKFYQEMLGLEFVQKLPTNTGTGWR